MLKSAPGEGSQECASLTTSSDAVVDFAAAAKIKPESDFEKSSTSADVKPEVSCDNSTSADNVPQKIPAPTRKLRQKLGNISTLIRCTACNYQFGVTFTSEVYQHPMLKVMICKKCHKWYSSAEILQGADGKDEQCRWCSEGGELICCDFCHNAFCKGCIRRNLGRKSLMDILNSDEQSKWSCYVCDPSPIFHLVEQCRAILDTAVTKNCKKKLARQDTKETGKKKDVQFKVVAKRPTVQAAAKSSLKSRNFVLPTNASRQRIFNSFCVRSSNSGSNASPMSSEQSSRKDSVFSKYPVNEQTGGISAKQRILQGRNCVGSIEVINELMAASSSRLNLLLLLNEELSLAGKRSSSLESMPTLAAERRKIAEYLWATHTSYLQLFRNVVQKLRPVVPRYDLPKRPDSSTLVRDVLPKRGGPNAQFCATPSAAALSSQSNEEFLALQEVFSGNVPKIIGTLIQSTVPEQPVSSRLQRGAGFDTKPAPCCSDFDISCNTCPDQNSLGAASTAPKCPSPSKRGRKRKHQPALG